MDEKKQPKGYSPSIILKKPQRTFLFRTGIRNGDLELCAVTHRYGKFTVTYMKPPADATHPDDLQKSVAKETWKDHNIDEDTGLKQVIGGWGCEDSVFIMFLRGVIKFNTSGRMIRGKSDEFEPTMY